MRSLHGKLSSRDEHQSLDLFLGVIDLLNERYRVRCGLSRSILGASNDVFALHCDRNSLLLNRGWSFITHLIYSQLRLFGESEILEGKSLSVGDVRGLDPCVLGRGKLSSGC